MTTKYSTPSVEAIQEDAEDDSNGEIKVYAEDSTTENSYRQARSPRHGSHMGSLKMESGKERERVKRSHRSGNSRKQHSKRDVTHSNTKYAGMPQPEQERPRRHRRNMSHHSSSSGSSSSEEEQDHREVLAQPKAKLTSPSIISTITSLTVSTNNSSGSSGSNSTVTQASITKQSERSLGKKPDIPEMPMSPAVPDPPNVFAYLDNESTLSLNIDTDQDEDDSDSSQEREDHEIEVDRQEQESSDEDEDEESDGDEKPRWPHIERLAILDSPTSPNHPDSSSSASSSVHGSAHFSETPAENDDTDRSTSPERSIHDQASDPDDDVPKSPASARMASQMAAAQQRQYLHSNSNQSQNQAFGTPNMSRGPAVYPYLPGSSSLSPRYAQHMKQRSLPRAEKLPVTGYELLASRLSNSSAQTEEPKIKPMYRKFESLNHRLLLHLQDEISELEEQLHRLDNADTQSRRAGLSGSVVPASRRAAQAAGGELQWHKTDILGRIGFKLAQYNQALSAFNATQSLNPPAPTDIDQYREYLHTEHPIVEAETHFLDPTDDLVSVCSETVRRYMPSLNPETQTSESSSVAFEQRRDVQPGLSGLAIAIAVSILVPILTFTVIPNFLGRMTVAGLVAGGVVFTLIQSTAVRDNVLGREGLICGGIYAGVMIVIAGIMG